MLEHLCRERLGLSAEEISQLLLIESTMQYTADLVGGDVFINCFYDDGERSLVVAEAKPLGDYSNYSTCIVGEDAYIENEPAVFAVRATGLPVRDLRATTQENKLVRQDVIPIKNSGGEVYAVLVREKDVSEMLRQDRKYDELVRMMEKLDQMVQKNGARTEPLQRDSLAAREIHHRIKNNLQMVASILNMQARRSDTPEIRSIFKENVCRVLSFAAIHETLTRNGLEDDVSILGVVDKVRRNTMIYTNHAEKHIDIQVTGADFLVPADQATSIALVVNELLTNAVKHAFPGRTEGLISIVLSRGTQYSSVTVSDNGIGFDRASDQKKNLGLAIVDMTVREQLRGRVQIFSGEEGSKIRFDFKN
ncbi:MAG: sensor histidine kinase [Oscillospiraceae bacterium]|jgi:two-component sensor histidine kinase|nr:sensor histidine kinase [Oscillospiraceae bacterium]